MLFLTPSTDQRAVFSKCCSTVSRILFSAHEFWRQPTTHFAAQGLLYALLTIAWRCGVGVLDLNLPFSSHQCPSTASRRFGGSTTAPASSTDKSVRMDPNGSLQDSISLCAVSNGSLVHTLLLKCHCTALTVTLTLRSCLR
jgi:hypothetical protein